MKRTVEELRDEFDNMGLRDCVEMFLARHPESPDYLTESELREQILFSPDALPKAVAQITPDTARAAMVQIAAE
jgi:hypothetical protein